MASPEYLAPYEDAAREHGPTFRATLWRDRDMQAGRFEVIAGMIDPAGRRVLDAGAGLGDLAAWMLKRRIRYAGYLGLEGVPEMAREAAGRELKRAAFRCIDFAADPGAFTTPFDGDPADVIVFSGSLNTFEAAGAREVVQRAWEGAAVGVVFNFLSSRRTPEGAPAPAPPEPGDPARRFDPLEMLDWALARTPKVLFRQDYFGGHDATIAMVR